MADIPGYLLSLNPKRAAPAIQTGPVGQCADNYFKFQSLELEVKIDLF